MAELRLTKSELREQQIRLAQLDKYLPTLQLKKAMLQSEVNEARLEIAENTKLYEREYALTSEAAKLLVEKTSISPTEAACVSEVKKSYENIAGVEVPHLEEVVFVDVHYDLFETPVWFDGLIHRLRETQVAKIRIDVSKEKKAALEEELRQVSIRVNLFEKVLIPRAQENIRKIRVFLGDQDMAAVGRAKVAKAKIEKQREALQL